MSGNDDINNQLDNYIDNMIDSFIDDRLNLLNNLINNRGRANVLVGENAVLYLVEGTQEEFSRVAVQAAALELAFCKSCSAFKRKICQHRACAQCSQACCQGSAPTGTDSNLMKLFKLDFNIKDRYRRGLAEGAKSNRSPQSEATATLSSYHDPHHHASSPSSPSALVSANSPSTSRDERMEQWNHFGSSSLEAAHSQTYAHPHARGGSGSIGRLHSGQDYGYDEHHEDDASNDGYMSSSSSSSGGSLSSSSLSPSSSHSSDDDDYDDDDDMQGGAGGGDYSGAEDSQDNEYSNSTHPFSIGSSKSADYHDYYQGSHGSGEHGGLLPAAPAPAIEPQSDREALEQEARQRRLERHADKRRQSLNGNQPAPHTLTGPFVLDMLRNEEKERRRQMGGREYRDYAPEDDDDDDDDDEDDGDDDEDEDDDEDYEDENEDDDREEDYEEDHEVGNYETHTMEYYEDAYGNANYEEFDPIADYSYGYRSDNNGSHLSHSDEEDVVSDESEGSDDSDESDGSESENEQDETYYDEEEDADTEEYHQNTTSSPSPSIYDDDASIYRDYHYQESDQVSEMDDNRDSMHQLLQPEETIRPSTAFHRSTPDQTTDVEDNQYFLGAVPEMKLSFGLDYSDNSSHLFGYPINHNIGNTGPHRQASQMASYDSGEDSGVSEYHSSSNTHDKPEGGHSSEVNHTFTSTERNHHQQQQQQIQQTEQQTQQHFDYSNSTLGHPPAVENTSQHPGQTNTFNHYHPSSNPAELQNHAQKDTDTTDTTTISSNNTRPRSSFLALPGPISTYWKRLKRGSSSSPSSSRPPYPP
ncbi:hypothetical protein EC991_009658 [Linnemannia zychae]|nr:hypothetical protein EC991_009658 [Linnemannia zychae]